jgi:hypothetical protein
MTRVGLGAREADDQPSKSGPLVGEDPVALLLTAKK